MLSPIYFFSSQMIVMIVSEWNSTEGNLFCFQRSCPTAEWDCLGSPIRVNVGKNGMAWGRGLHGNEHHMEPQKKEGDGKSPAGIFSLGPVFGNEAHQPYAKNMPFLLVDKDLHCVDDPASLHYNRFVKTSTVQTQDWKSSESMFEMGSSYSLGVVIGHNTHPIAAGEGSCIFMHIRANQSKGTEGCTTMDENDLKEIVTWLDQDKYPCLIQLPL
jgi:L,D-peptidoglycan transpeptidase YkuD (ErfK/YbiS/YcfS/YnhG family)